MVIAILTYRKPLAEVDRFLQAHRDFLDRYYAEGKLIASGPRIPREGGVIMIKAESRSTAEEILAQDPFRINGIADYNLVEFTPTKFMDPGLEAILR